MKTKFQFFRRSQIERLFFTGIKKAREIKTKKETTDQEIDKMVYALYELTEEDIWIVEG